MGSTASKTASNTVRKFPAQASQAAVRSRPQAPRPQQSQPKPSGQQNGTPHSDDSVEEVTPAFSQRLQTMGVVQPNPTFSPSSTVMSHSADAQPTPLAPNFPSIRSNPTLSVLEARRMLQQQADMELESMAQRPDLGRRFLDMRTVMEAMQMREHGLSDADIETKLKIRPGLISKLGKATVFL
ncbi:hypothetical protein B0I35DRAFT_477886 [Stachybotrys elegans]|uniref:Helix-turn-helix domain-containing protein n=1 Tax=Stachybotrys elegans TaxID=80388 RepID=A0A8K0SUV3_9HYPO|nr:hypothetical protein B0I35DRAFT_477886 [Stachybotrys elegans]